MEHNGDLFACDHYVYPRYKLGNILSDSMADLVDGEMMREFGEAKRAQLPRQCRECDVLFMCNGDCPKHRFASSANGEPGLSYLCPAYYLFFKHSAPAMKQMAQLYQVGRAPAEIMSL
jgi:uncharacterized protein